MSKQTPAENDVPCQHLHVKSFRSHPPRAVCQDCGATVRLSWSDPAVDTRPIPPGSIRGEGDDA